MVSTSHHRLMDEACKNRFVLTNLNPRIKQLSGKKNFDPLHYCNICRTAITLLYTSALIPCAPFSWNLSNHAPFQHACLACK
uniref:Uncharacterized protein n=1 Tax=Populus trichocarpa TaxID=3694 RepID=U5FW22_POPTR